MWGFIKITFHCLSQSRCLVNDASLLPAPYCLLPNSTTLSWLPTHLPQCVGYLCKTQISFLYLKTLIAPLCLKISSYFLAWHWSSLEPANIPFLFFAMPPHSSHARWLPKQARHCQASWPSLMLKLLHAIIFFSFTLHSPAYPSRSRSNVTNSLKASPNLQILLRCWYDPIHYLIDRTTSLIPLLGLCVLCISVFLVLSDIPST